MLIGTKPLAITKMEDDDVRTGDRVGFFDKVKKAAEQAQEVASSVKREIQAHQPAGGSGVTASVAPGAGYCC